MAKRDLEFSVSRVSVEPNNGSITVLIEDVSEDDILEYFNIKEVISYFGAENLLKEIGETEARAYFGIEEA